MTVFENYGRVLFEALKHAGSPAHARCARKTSGRCMMFQCRCRFMKPAAPCNTPALPCRWPRSFADPADLPASFRWACWAWSKPRAALHPPRLHPLRLRQLRIQPAVPRTRRPWARLLKSLQIRPTPLPLPSLRPHRPPMKRSGSAGSRQRRTDLTRALATSGRGGSLPPHSTMRSSPTSGRAPIT